VRTRSLGAVAFAVAASLGVMGASTPAGADAARSARAVLPEQVIEAQTQTAQTPEGAVGYRELGAGSPLVLIMGLGGSMDEWPPSFVAALASRHHVVLVDNAGVGSTALISPLTITTMADEVSALMSDLDLGRAAVLGWSMGGMEAQALAVLHPGQVSKLVLAATQPGSGHALPIPPAAAAKAASTNPAEVLSVLFPSTALSALGVYVKAILRYPDSYRASPAVVAEQGTAISQWMAGDDAAGRRFEHVKAPTLVADGTEDQLNPVANDRALAGAVHASKLVLYRGAGHAFLFQDSTRFLPVVERFLG